MPSIFEEIGGLKTIIRNLSALLMGERDQGKWYAMIGTHVVYGCKITAPGLAGAGMALALDGQAVGDATHLNPDAASPPCAPRNTPTSRISTARWRYSQTATAPHSKIPR